MPRSFRLALAALALCTAPTQAQWVPTGGPAGGAFSLVAGLDGALVAATPYASLRYTDAGGWTSLPIHVTEAVAAGDHLLARTPDGLALSPDDGASFFPLAGAPRSWRPLAVDAGGLVATSADSFRVSGDGGVTWRAVQDSVWVTPRVGTSTQRFPVPLSQPVGALLDGSTLLVAGTAYVFGGVYRLAPTDTTWVALVAPGAPDLSDSVQPYGLVRHEGALWFSHTRGVHRSSDGGATWVDVSASLPASPAGYTLQAGAAGLVAAARSNATLAQWTGAGWTTLPALPSIRTHVTVGADIVATTFEAAYRLDGAGWAALPGVVASSPVPLAASVGPDAALLVASGTRLLRTVDGGATYATARTDLRGRVAVDGDRVIATTFSGLVRSDDGGQTWTVATLPAVRSGVPPGPVALHASGGDLWAFYGYTRGVEHGGILWRYGAAFRSADAGASWTEVSAGLPTTSLGAWPVRAAADFGTAQFVETEAGCLALPTGASAWVSRTCPAGTLRAGLTTAAGWTVRTSTGIASSTDGGLTWTPLVNGLPAADPVTFWSTARLAPTASALMLVATVGDRALAFRLDGATWTPLDHVFPDGVRWTDIVEAADGTLYGGTYGHGLWRLPRGVVGTAAGPSAPLTLDPPQPNPAAGGVRLAFTLPSAGAATLTVVDALGRRVAQLADGQQAAGRHEVTWRASVAPGVYVVRLATDTGVRTQRLTVVR